MAEEMGMRIPPYIAEKLDKYLDLWEALETRELTPEERLLGIQQMNEAKNELFVHAILTASHHRRLNGL